MFLKWPGIMQCNLYVLWPLVSNPRLQVITCIQKSKVSFPLLRHFNQTSWIILEFYKYLRWYWRWWWWLSDNEGNNRDKKISRVLIKSRGLGISPGYYDCGPRLLLLENRRKIKPKEIPSCLIPCLLVVFTRQLEILVTSLISDCDYDYDDTW